MRPSQLLKSLPSVALGLALLLVALLAGQGRALRREVRSLRAELGRVWLDGRTPPVGLTVPSFRLATLAGDSATLGRSTGGQVLFFFNTVCGFCRETLPHWHTIADSARRVSPPIGVFGITDEAEPRVRLYADQLGVTFDVALLPDSALPIHYRAELVPLTVVVSPTGTIVHARRGLLSPVAVDSILHIAVSTSRAAPAGARRDTQSRR